MTTLDLQIGADDRDGYDDGINFRSRSSSGFLKVGGKDSSGNALTSGLAWENVTIPQGATIESASLDLFESWGGNYGPLMQTRIYGAKVANIGLFSATNKPKDIPKTIAFVDWDSVDGNMGSNWYSATVNEPPDLTAIIQEIVDQAEWESGNALGLIVADDGSWADWWFEVKSYEEGASTAAKLHIVYTANGGITPAPATAKAGTVNPTIEAALILSPGFISAKAAAINLVIEIALILSPSFIFARGSGAGPIVIGGGINPLGEGDSPGFIAFMLARSTYENLKAAGLDAGLNEPDETNAGEWDTYLFG